MNNSSANPAPDASGNKPSFLAAFDLDSFDDDLVRRQEALLHEYDFAGVDLHPDLLWRYSNLVNNAVLQIASGHQRPRFRRIALRPFFRVVQAEAAALTKFLLASGYKLFASQDEFDRPEQRSCYMRFDIHHCDISGAYGFVDYHLATQIPATFYLEWGALDFTPEQKLDFIILAETITNPLQIGIHASPVDNYLCWTICEGNFLQYIAYMKSDSWLQEAKRIIASDSATDSFHHCVLEHFAANVAEFNSVFPNNNGFNASHGGVLSQFFRGKTKEMHEIGTFIESLWAENWLTPERAAGVGLKGDVEQCGLRFGVAKLSDRGGRAQLLARVSNSIRRRDAPCRY
jgi:hypothetical protein